MMPRRNERPASSLLSQAHSLGNSVALFSPSSSVLTALSRSCSLSLIALCAVSCRPITPRCLPLPIVRPYFLSLSLVSLCRCVPLSLHRCVWSPRGPRCLSIVLLTRRVLRASRCVVCSRHTNSTVPHFFQSTLDESIAASTSKCDQIKPRWSWRCRLKSRSHAQPRILLIRSRSRIDISLNDRHRVRKSRADHVHSSLLLASGTFFQWSSAAPHHRAASAQPRDRSSRNSRTPLHLRPICGV